MPDSNYLPSLSQELNALKNRVRSFIASNHSLTDGEWKESVLRTFLRRHLPINAEVGRGFVINSEGASRQIDVLIYDSNFLMLFRDGDLVFVTPDAVLGIVEVKTSLDNSGLKKAIETLSSNSELVLHSKEGKRSLCI